MPASLFEETLHRGFASPEPIVLHKPVKKQFCIMGLAPGKIFVYEPPVYEAKIAMKSRIRRVFPFREIGQFALDSLSGDLAYSRIAVFDFGIP